jgi:multidrug transporter EmrE-like cation transporter
MVQRTGMDQGWPGEGAVVAIGCMVQCKISDDKIMNLIILTIVLMISLCEACGQSIAFIAYQKRKIALLLVAWLFYLFVVYFLYQAYKYKGVGYVNILWSGITTLLMITIGYFLFKERLNKIEWIGAGFIIIGMIILLSFRSIKMQART